MYFRLLSFTWQRNIKIFDICINNTATDADPGQVERQIRLEFFAQPQTTHISCLELGKFKKPAHAKGHGMEAVRSRAKYATQAVKTKPWNFCPPESGVLATDSCWGWVQWLWANKICVKSSRILLATRVPARCGIVKHVGKQGPLTK